MCRGLAEACRGLIRQRSMHGQENHVVPTKNLVYDIFLRHDEAISYANKERKRVVCMYL